MSTLAYAALTTRREEAAPGTSRSINAPGVNTYVDALAALVPAEVLSLHAMILSFTTETEGDSTTITAADTLRGAFYGLVALAIVLYVVPRIRKWDRLDYLRVLIPPAAFVAWTMLQRATAFDAIAGDMSSANRSVIALFVAVLLGLLAASLASNADQKPPPHHTEPETDPEVIVEPEPNPGV